MCKDCAARVWSGKKQAPIKVKPKVKVGNKLLHTALYYAKFGYGDEDYVPSEISGSPAVDVHHIDCKGVGGSKSKDRIENLMALTRDEHVEYGDKKQYMSWLFQKHLDFMLASGVKFDASWIEAEIEKYEEFA